MRIVAEVSHPECKITIFSWNQKYLLKLEQGLIEQTYKISEHDVRGDSDVKKLVQDEEFMKAVLGQFEGMQSLLNGALERL